jgi:UDP-glucose 4-epimerase/UDP-glucuronate 4-epimerase
MTNLIIGGAGFVGLNLVEAGLRRADKVIAFDRSPLPETAARSFALLPGELCIVQGDVTNQDDILRVIKDNKVAHIFHGAAVTAGQKREEEEPELVLSVNTIGLINTLKASKVAGTVKRIINVSSGSAYGDGGFGDTGWTGRLDEYKTVDDPITLYAISKYASERIARRLGKVMALDVCNVRLSAIFGPWEYDTGLRDTLSAPMQASLLALSGSVAILSRKESRDWTYSRDVAEALFALMDNKSLNYDLYNITSGSPWSVQDWCDCLVKTFPNFSYKFAGDNDEPNVDLFGERDRLTMSSEKLIQDTGYILSDNVEKMYGDFEKWIQESRGFWE